LSLFAPCAKRGAFTIVELIAALGVLSILAGISYAGFSSLRADAQEDKARSDLRVIQVGIEAYRAKFGLYPVVPDLDEGGAWDGLGSANSYLLNALNGRLGPQGDEIDHRSMLNNAALDFSAPELPHEGLQDNEIVDPWGNPYIYQCKPMQNGSPRFGYQLSSRGPDGLEGTNDDIEAR